MPEGALTAGENEIGLTWPSSGTRSGTRARSALASVFVGPARPEDAATPEPMPWERTGADRIGFGPGEGAAYYVVLPPQASLRLQPSFMGAEAPSDCELGVSLSSQNGLLSRHGVVPGRLPESQREAPVEVALGDAPAGEVLRLELHASATCPALALESAALTIAGDAPSIPAFEPPRNVIVYLVDTLRADRPRAINPGTRVLGEAFERFAAEGTTFAAAYVQGNESFASHAALFSGRFPSATGVFNSADHLGAGNELLEELAQRAELYTGGYSSNGHIRSTNGFEQGFRHFVNTLRDNYRYKAPGMLTHATRFVDEHLDERFFFYLGTVDCHVTYRSHEDILPLYDPEPYSGPFRRNVGGDELGAIKSGAMRITARDRFRIEAIYDDTVTYTDRHFGLLLEHLEETGILDQTMIILTSDHGDEFWEHGSVGHGHNVYEELVHVPLLVRYPAAFPAGRVVEVGVDTVDILPTIAAALGVEPDEEVQGESLIGLAHGVDAAYPRPAYTQMYGHTMAMRLANWKVVWRTGGERRLYDLDADPTEQEDVADDHPYALRFVSDAMGTFLPYRSTWRKARWGVASNLRAGFPE